MSSAADDKERVLQDCAETVYGKGVAISYDPIPEAAGIKGVKGIVWSKDGRQELLTVKEPNVTTARASLMRELRKVRRRNP